MKHILGYYIARFKLWLHRKNYKAWWVGVHCTACGRNVFKREGDYFVLRNKIWRQACRNIQASTTWILCKRCTERALGRKLRKTDYYKRFDETINEDKIYQ